MLGIHARKPRALAGCWRGVGVLLAFVLALVLVLGVLVLVLVLGRGKLGQNAFVRGWWWLQFLSPTTSKPEHGIEHEKAFRQAQA